MIKRIVRVVTFPLRVVIGAMFIGVAYTFNMTDDQDGQEMLKEMKVVFFRLW